MHKHIIPKLTPRASPLRHLTRHDNILSDRGTDFKRGASFRERKKALLLSKYKYEQANMRSSILFWISINVSESNFPIGHRIAAHLLHIEFAKTGGALFPRASIKTSFGKVAAFYSSLSRCFFATSPNKLQQSSSESGLLETKSKVREGGGDELGQKTERARKLLVTH